MGKPDFDDLQSTHKYSAIKAYGTAKLFNIYFTKSLAERYKSKGITAFALHPGVVRSAFWDDFSGWQRKLLFLIRPFMITAEQGAQTSIYLATTPKLDAKSGQYFKKQLVAKPSDIANDEAARNRLWDLCLQLSAGFLA
jgi:NAD(P)-dependent dehydrogenase (short-subunit alcohol dehydrogenase family)